MMRAISCLCIVVIVISCTSDNFINTKRIISTDKDQYKVGDQFKLTLTIFPMKGRKKIRIYDNYKNLEISFSLVDPDKKVLNEDETPHSGQFLSNGKIVEWIIDVDNPFTKTFSGEIIEDKDRIILSIPELEMSVWFEAKKVLDGAFVRIHGFCNPIKPSSMDSLEDYFEGKDIRIVAK